MRSGDPCGKCSAGYMRTYCTRRLKERACRFLICDKCKATGKEFIPLPPGRAKAMYYAGTSTPPETTFHDCIETSSGDNEIILTKR
jgi:hypothetical protein